MLFSQGVGPCDFVFSLPTPGLRGCTEQMPFFPCQSGANSMAPLNSTSAPYFAQGTDNFIYKINVCGPVRDGGDCQAADGMLCKYDSTGTKFIDVLSVWDGGPGLSWTKGVMQGTLPGSLISVVEAYTMNGIGACDSTGRSPRVLWRFTCGRTETQFSVQPDQTGCLYTVMITTPLACPV